MEKQANFHNLLMATSTNVIGFAMRGDEVFRRCIDCGMTFPQTDDDIKALREHEMEHGRPTTVEPLELDGKSLRIFVVETENELSYGDDDELAYDVYGQDEDGFVYHLTSVSGYGSGLWKWKRSPHNNLPLPTPNAQE